jgi:hypothetical protein
MSQSPEKAAKNFSFLLCLLWHDNPRCLTFASLITAIHSDQSWAFHLEFLFPIILRFAWTSSNHHSFGLPNFLFLSSFASNTVLGIQLFFSLNRQVKALIGDNR